MFKVNVLINLGLGVANENNSLVRHDGEMSP